MIVDEKLVVESKSTYEVPKAAKRQVYNYLRATKLEVGLLLHFGPEANFYRLDFRHASQDEVRRIQERSSEEDHTDIKDCHD